MGFFKWILSLFKKTDAPPILIDTVESKEHQEPEVSKEPKLSWMEIAEKEIGISESKNPKRVIEYHQATKLKANDTKTPWCSSFVNWVFAQVEIKGTNSAWAREWLLWGQECKPKYGCVFIFERNAPGGDSHVAFYTGEETEDSYFVLGGNQRDKVCIQSYPKKDLLGCRWPK